MHIVALEDKVSDLSIMAEKGSIAMEQIEIMRESLQAKTLENRKITMENNDLKNELKDHQYNERNNKAIAEMMEDYKRRSEKVTGLVAEVARLRGSSRACSKALSDSDNVIANYDITTMQ